MAPTPSPSPADAPQVPRHPPNPSLPLEGVPGGPLAWVPCSTALLVVHGIGNQQPYETLDDFARGLLAAYTAGGVDRVSARHEVTLDEDEDGHLQRRSFIRLERPGSPHVLDLHEYYWAPETEGEASLGDIQRWLRGVAREAGRFYRDQVEVALEAGEESMFFPKKKDPVSGKVTATFNVRRYQFFLQVVGLLIPAGARIVEGLIEMVRRIPLLGPALGKWLDRVQESKTHQLANVVGDITVYNTMDARSPHFEVRGRIRAAAVRALRDLVAAERRAEDGAWGWAYERVVVAGHSLGSQVAFDALNGLLDLAGEGRLDGFNTGGDCVVSAEAPNAPRFRSLGELLGGFVTFGSPLDKIAFFLSDRTPPEHYFLRQLRRQAFSFKQRALSLTASTAFVLRAPQRPQLDHVAWINFHDENDYVSGSLDFYQQVVNLNCGFPARFGTGPLRALRWGWWAWAAVAVLFLLGTLGGFLLNLLALRFPGLRDSWTAYVIDPTLFSWLFKLLTTPLGGWFSAMGGQSLASMFLDFLPFWLWLGATFLLVTATAWYAGLNFTHSKYWSHPPMYAALIRQMLQRDQPATHEVACRELGACAEKPHETGVGTGSSGTHFMPSGINDR